MKIEYYNEYSPNLGRHMELKVYGHAGKPVLVFPSQCGRFYESEGFGMIDAASGFIESGKAQFFCVDGLDWETFVNDGWPGDRLHRFEQYFNYIIQRPLIVHVRQVFDRRIPLFFYFFFFENGVNNGIGCPRSSTG